MIKSRRMGLAGNEAHIGRRIMHIEFWWETRKKMPLGTLRCNWEYIIKMDLRLDGVVCTGLI
jgi:hypothetical protein